MDVPVSPWRDPSCGEMPWRPRGRHAAPGRCRRAARAARRGAARVTAFPLWPGYIVYRSKGGS